MNAESIDGVRRAIRMWRSLRGTPIPEVEVAATAFEATPDARTVVQLRGELVQHQLKNGVEMPLASDLADDAPIPRVSAVLLALSNLRTACDAALACTFPSVHLVKKGQSARIEGPYSRLDFSHTEPVGEKGHVRVRLAGGGKRELEVADRGTRLEVAASDLPVIVENISDVGVWIDPL